MEQGKLPVQHDIILPLRRFNRLILNRFLRLRLLRLRARARRWFGAVASLRPYQPAVVRERPREIEPSSALLRDEN